jgi:hypothetical protein
MGSTMPRAKRSIQSAVAIDGFSLIWRLYREQQWCTADRWKGVAIHVSVAAGARRELYLEYPPVRTHKVGYTRVDPVQQRISPAKVEAHIRQAMEAGWDPSSRGKPFVYQVPELPS